MSDYVPKAGELFDEKYELIEAIGSGGVATVFKARQVDINRLVALKVVHHEWAQDPEMKARFLQEAVLLNKLRHENIVTIYHLGIAAIGLPYIAFELLPGQSLKALIQKEGRLSLERACHVCSQVCKALSFAHKEGVVHRDIKPENIFLQDDPNADFVKVIDFGLAKFSTPENHQTIQKLTQTGLLIGSVNYMSPEQCQGQKVDFRTDIYSLSSTFFEMLAGTPPYDSENSMAVIYQHMNDKVPKIKSLKSGESPKYAQLFIEKGMDKNPQLRFSSMEDMNAACKSLLTNKVKENSLTGPSIAILALLTVAGTVTLLMPKHRDLALPKQPKAQSSISKKKHNSQTVEGDLNQILTELADTRYKFQRSDENIDAKYAATSLSRLTSFLDRKFKTPNQREILFLANIEKGRLERELRKPDSESLHSMNEALKYSRTAEGEDTAESAEPYFELAKIYYDLNKNKEAKELLIKTLRLKERMEEADPTLKSNSISALLQPHYPRTNVGSAHLFFAEIARTEGNYDLALKEIELSLKSTRGGPDAQEAAMLQSYDIHSLMGQRTKALNILKNYEKSLVEYAGAYTPNISGKGIEKELLAENPAEMVTVCEHTDVIIMHLSRHMYDKKEYALAESFALDLLALIERTNVGTAKIPEIHEWIAKIRKQTEALKSPKQS